jgi:hypothetical protein
VVKEIVNNAITSLRGQPLALALVVINLAFLVGLTLVFREISESTQRKDALVIEMLKQCGGR